MSSNPEHKREAIYIKEKISFLNIQHTSVIIDFSFLLNFLQINFLLDMMTVGARSKRQKYIYINIKVLNLGN